MKKDVNDDGAATISSSGKVILDLIEQDIAAHPERLPQALYSSAPLVAALTLCSRCPPSRVVRFVAGRIAHGFTVCYACPLCICRHLTRCIQHRHGLEHFSSFGPSLPTGSYYDLC